MQKVIAWDTGTGNITLTYTGEGDDSVTVSSDQNNLSVERSQTLTFKTTGISRQVTVTQGAKPEPREGTFTGHPTSYDSTNYSYYSVSSMSNGYTDSSSTNYATINLTRGRNATTYVYFKFDTSSIPANATITSVNCTCKCYISNTNSSRVTTRQVQLYSGTSGKGSAYTVSTSTSTFSMTAGTWTRSELSDARIRLYAVRGTSSTTTSIYFRFYGATLTVEYEYT